jgi:uncharacterized glyoxalase superfamily protein PhnB
VQDVAAAQRYYRDTLGFELRWTWQDSYAAVEIGDVEMLLVQADDPTPVTIMVVVDDADAVYTELLARGARITEQIASRFWACGSSAFATWTAT